MASLLLFPLYLSFRHNLDSVLTIDHQPNASQKDRFQVGLMPR